MPAAFKTIELTASQPRDSAFSEWRTEAQNYGYSSAMKGAADRKYCRPHARPFRLGFPRKVPMFPICPLAAL
jgi:hypothetical protein